MYKDKQLIILMAGLGTRLYPLTLTTPKPLLSVKQKPSIYNMIVPLIKDGIENITFVVNEENKNIIKKFMDNSFSNLNIKFNYIIQNDFSGPGEAFRLTKDVIEKEVILLLGDTLCTYPEEYDKSFIGCAKVSEKEASAYCILTSDENGKITKLEDKPKDVNKISYAAIGLYFFKNYKLLKKVLNSKINKTTKEVELSIYFNKYMEKENMYIEEIDDWEDIGSLENYIKVNKNNFNCRVFNSLYLDDIKVLHKKSSWDKISSEINWYKDIINTDFEKITPKFYNNNKFNNEYGIEYYDYLTLSEYLTFYPLYDFNKSYIFKNLVDLLINIYKKNKIISLSFSDYMKEILVTKTHNRIKKWERTDLVNKDELIINDKKYLGLYPCLDMLSKRINNICKDSINYVSLIHGDPSLSNILFSPRNMIFKLIDPRGNFVVDTSYGDYRYDIAKLRHCYHGRYDEIINDLFNIKESKNKLNLTFYKDNKYEEFDEILKENKININDIELIEGLLFISMIALHSDYKERQLAFFIQGIKMLNNQIEVKI